MKHGIRSSNILLGLTNIGIYNFIYHLIYFVILCTLFLLIYIKSHTKSIAFKKIIIIGGQNF
jgi:hypothetical protein